MRSICLNIIVLVIITGILSAQTKINGIAMLDQIKQNYLSTVEVEAFDFGSYSCPITDVLFERPPWVNEALFCDEDSPVPLQRVADDFIFDEEVTITSLCWLGAYGFANTHNGVDDFTIIYYNDYNGKPHTIHELIDNVIPLYKENTGNTGTLTGPVELDIYGYYYEHEPVKLTAGKKYWLSIVNNTRTDQDDGWSWVYSTSKPPSATSLDGGYTWGIWPFGDLVYSLGSGGPIRVCCMPDGSCNLYTKERCTEEGGKHIGESLVCPEPSTWYADLDNDGYSDGTTMMASCQPDGFKLLGDLVGSEVDCNDDPNNGGAAFSPGVSEVCDGIDNDCDGLVDDDDPNITGQNTFYADADLDGFGNPATSILSCSQPNGYVSNFSDNCPLIYGLKLDPCDDGNPNTIGDFINDNCECDYTELIPTLSQWGLILLSLSFLILGVVGVRRKVLQYS